MRKKFVSWRRVSTLKQSRSGLGLEAQREIIRYFVEREKGELIADFQECYTGTELSGCVELKKAMALAKQENAILVIAKTDRFRNTIEALQVYEEMGDGNIMFCDLPHTDKFTLTLFFALAEREALIISIRTKQALAEKKRRGEKLGASSDKWKATVAAKSDTLKSQERHKQGRTKSGKYMASKDVMAFFKILRSVFTEHCANEDKRKWNWGQINTRKENRLRIIQLMRDYKELDGSGELFKTWNLSSDSDEKLRMKIVNQINSIKRALFNDGTTVIEEENVEICL